MRPGKRLLLAARGALRGQKTCLDAGNVHRGVLRHGLVAKGARDGCQDGVEDLLHGAETAYTGGCTVKTFAL